MGVDPVYGARPMKCYILQRNLETQIAKEMIKTGAMQGNVINVDCYNGEIHSIFKEDSEISSFLFLFGGIIVPGSDVMSLKDWIQKVII